jgi:hypothetical protein
MHDWFTDPKSIAVITGAVLSVGIGVWQGRQTAAIVADLVKWRLETAAPAFERLAIKVGTMEHEVERLRNLREGP